METSKHIKIVKLDNENKDFLDQISELFISTNPNAIISILGKDFVKEFISNFYKLEDRNIYLGVYKNKVVAYIFYLHNINEIKNIKINYLNVLIICLKRPLLLTKLIKKIRKNKFRKSFNNETGYLMYLGVKKDFQRTGLGKNLIHNTVKLLPNSVKQLITDTKTKEVEIFFQKNGFTTLSSTENSFYLMKRALN